MSDEKQKKIFSKNLSFYLEKSGKSQKEVAKAIGVIPQTFNTWCTGQSIPRMGSVQALADYFGIGKSDLIEEKSDQAIELTKKDEKDIAKRLEQTLDRSLVNLFLTYWYPPLSFERLFFININKKDTTRMLCSTPLLYLLTVFLHIFY